jgi:hypothetical protein
MRTIRDLMAEARRLGVTVQLAHLDEEGLFGLYDNRERMITIDLGITMPEKLETFAHELSHCYYGDACSTRSNERRADRRAAHILIDPLEYRAAELIDPDPAAIAAELGQTRYMVRIFQKEFLPTLSLSRRLRAG